MRQTPQSSRKRARLTITSCGIFVWRAGSAAVACNLRSSVALERLKTRLLRAFKAFSSKAFHLAPYLGKGHRDIYGKYSAPEGDKT